jgi:hypothetical protein
VRDKTSANFCDHFKPRAGAYTAPNATALSQSQAALEDLFGKR